MQQLTDSLWNSLLAGDLKAYYVQLFNSYTPFGMFFWMVGFALFGIIQLKTKDYTYAGAVSAVYFYVIGLPELGLITDAYAAMAMQYFGLMLSVVTGYYIYKALKG